MQSNTDNHNRHCTRPCPSWNTVISNELLRGGAAQIKILFMVHNLYIPFVVTGYVIAQHSGDKSTLMPIRGLVSFQNARRRSQKSQEARLKRGLGLLRQNTHAEQNNNDQYYHNQQDPTLFFPDLLLIHYGLVYVHIGILNVIRCRTYLVLNLI